MCTYQIVTKIDQLCNCINSVLYNSRPNSKPLTDWAGHCRTVACTARPTGTITMGYIPVMICFWESARSDNFLQINAGSHKSSAWMLVYLINCRQLSQLLVIISASGIAHVLPISPNSKKRIIINYNSSRQAFCSAGTTTSERPRMTRVCLVGQLTWHSSPFPD